MFGSLLIWGLLAHTYGTRPTLATVAALFAAYLALIAQRDAPFGDRHPRSSPEPGLSIRPFVSPGMADENLVATGWARVVQ
jgi:hypothetical protein